MNCETCRYSGSGWHEHECSRPTTGCRYQPIERHKPEAKKEVKNLTDVISRRAAIDICHKNYDGILDFRSDGWTVASSFEDIINSVPPVQSDWNEMFVVCDCCGHAIHIKKEQLPSVQPERKPCKGCVHFPQRYKFPCTSCARNTLLLDRWEEGKQDGE